MQRQLKRFAIGGALLLTALFAGAWLLAGSPYALQWLVTEATQRSNGALAFEGVSGSLLGRVQVSKLKYTTPDLRITLDDVALNISRIALLQRRLAVVTIEAGLVDIHTASSDKPLTPPDSLALPFDVDIKNVQIAQARFKDQVFNQLTFDYQGGKAGHALKSFSAQTHWGRLTGDVRIAANRPFVLSGQAKLARPDAWDAQLELSGNLLALDVIVRGAARGATGEAVANIALFEPHWLRKFRAHGENINTAAFVSGLPVSAIQFDVTGASGKKGGHIGTFTIQNAKSGPTRAKRLSLVKVSSDYALQDATTLMLTNLVADLGTGGTLHGNGELSFTASRPYQAQLSFDRLDPAAFGDYPQASITGRLNVSGMLAPQWQAQVALTLANSQLRGVRLAGNAAGEITAQRARDIRVALTAGANALRINGSYGRSGDKLTFVLDAPRLSQLNTRLAGALSATGQLAGDVRRPQLAVDITGNQLVLDEHRWIDMLRLRASGTLPQHKLMLAMQGEGFDLNAHAEGGWSTTRGWAGTLTSLENTGTYPMQLQAPTAITYAQGRYSAGPAQLEVAGGRVALTSLAWRDGRLDTIGELANLPLAPLFAIAGMPTPRTTLRVSGAWSVTSSPRLNGQLTLRRESGDFVTPGEAAIALGLEQLRIEARLVNGALDATFELRAPTMRGRMHATATALAGDASLKLDGKIDIASLRTLDPLVGTQGLLRGNAAITLTGSGTLAAPRLNGSLVAANLGVEAPQYGLRLRDGTLKAELDDQMLTLREFSIRGDEGTLTAAGAMARAPEGAARLSWQASHLLLLNRPDMRLKIDGSGSAALADKKLVLRGMLTADEGQFKFDLPRPPRLADDIVIVGRPRAAARSGMRTTFQTELLDIDMVLDAGERLRIEGAGLDTYLRGNLNLKTNSQGVLEARGVLSSARGIYYVFGQRLEIERGRLIFDGPPDNPALDILAKRKNLAVEAGVEVAGTVRVPNVRLVSEPSVPDSEKIAWLTLGHGLQDATSADLALLQTAASTLIGKGNAVPLTQRIASQIGLDELSLRGSGQAGSQVAALGKRLSDKLYVEYEQGLAATSTVLRLSYALTRSLSLRLETGFTSGLGFYFTRSYD